MVKIDVFIGFVIVCSYSLEENDFIIYFVLGLDKIVFF